MSSEKISLILVDDHSVVREGLRAYLSTEPDIEVIGEASNGRQALKLAADGVPDVALVDLVMPDPTPGPTGPMDGIGTIRELKKVSPHTQIIVLTSYAEDEKIFPAVRAGALSYMLKDVSAEDLVQGIRAAAGAEGTPQ